MMKTKLCRLCGLERSRLDFNRRARSSDGLQSKCRTCESAYYAQNKERCVARVMARRKIVPQKPWAGRNEYQARYREANRELCNARVASHYWQNREKRLEQCRQYRAASPDKYKAAVQAWARANPDRVRAKSAKRRAVKLQATPSWADARKIQEFYFAADFLGMVTGEWYHVDHIVPLQSEIVCGLHCELNMQVLPDAINRSKSNRRWPDMPAAKGV